MEIYSGNYQVIESGSVITFDANSGVEMVIKPSTFFSFRVIIKFEENGGERDIVKLVDEKSETICITCVNFDLGAGTVEPLELATTGGKKVYFHLWVEKVSANNFIRRVEYTAFRER